MKKNFRYPENLKEKAIEELKKLAGDRHWAIEEKNKVSSWNGETTFFSAYIDSVGHTDIYATWPEVIEEMKRLVAEEIKKYTKTDQSEHRVSLSQWLELSRAK